MTPLHFHVGQKVVCVDDRLSPGEPGPYVRKGAIYTIASILVEYRGVCTLLFEELEPVEVEGWDTGYKARCFRPLVKRKADIGVFTRMLEPTREKERAG